MGRIGRPATKPARLMDGFYIEVRNKGSKDKAIRIRTANKEAMELAAKEYEKNQKEVIILGEYKNDEWLAEHVVTKKSA